MVETPRLVMGTSQIDWAVHTSPLADEEHLATPTSEKIIPLSSIYCHKKVTMGFLAVSPISLNVERLILD